MARICTIHN